MRLILLFALMTGGLSATSFTFSGHFENPDWFRRFNSIQPSPFQLGADRSEIVQDPQRGHTVLKVKYPKGEIDSHPSGASWITYLGGKFESMTVSYYVKFEKDFTFVKGGKLPGLIGGARHGVPHSTLTGGFKPDGTDGWSARVMWRKDGRVVQYIYHPDQPDKWGEDFPWMIDGKPAQFLLGRWHHLKTEIRMNTPTQNNGIIRSWFDGQEALEVTNLRFRDIPTIAIDALYFSTFFGGDEPDWAPPRDVHAFFDDFVVRG
ncbi:MAG: hypothetical protein HYR96_14700 [Deltaproteobacteria bacterium]|nr:hypothetical protein [Deltaproteobacteria bacterium]MBI3294832.1 hypothetical protein [Deltaproteobacteria bacterium]